MKIIVDRFEDGLAVVETPDHHFFDMPLALLPEGVGVGSAVIISADPDEEKLRRERLAQRAKKL